MDIKSGANWLAARLVGVDLTYIVALRQVLAKLDTEKLEATLEHAGAILMAAEARQTH